MLVRAARLEDLKDIHQLIMYYANQGALLPRTRESLAAHLPQLAVVYQGSTLAGVVALHRLEPSVSEVRSLAVDPAFQKQGIGEKLVRFAVKLAQEQGYHKVIAFTRQVGFFEHCGFYPVAHKSVPAKYFIDCVGCPMLAHCDETAMERVLLVPNVNPSVTAYPASSLT